RARVTDRTVAAPLEGEQPSKGGLCGLQNSFQRRREEVVLLARPDGDANGAGSSERSKRADDDAFAKQSFEDRPRVLAHLDVDEVRHRRSGDRQSQALT